MSHNEISNDIRGFKRFTMASNLRLTDNTGEMQTEYRPHIERLIQALPKRLRRRPMSLSLRQPVGAPCDLHLPLNGELVANMFYFVQVEVTEHFRQFEAFPELCHPLVEEILVRLRALRGMWIKPGQDVPILNAWNYQINGCQACMLARVASDKSAVRNLRAVILSRTRTRKRHRPRTLMAFIDGCSNEFGEDVAQEIYNTSNQLAFEIKAARKTCTKAYLRRRGSGNHHHSVSSRDRHSTRRKTENGGHVRASGASSMPLMQIPEDEVVPTQAPSRLHQSQACAAASPRQSRRTEREPSSTRYIQAEDTNPGPDAVDNMMELYKAIGEKKPFSRDTLVPSAMVAPLDLGTKKGRINEDMGAFRGRTDEEIIEIKDRMDRLKLIAIRPPLSGLSGADNMSSTGTTSNSRIGRDMLAGYQYSPSENPRAEGLEDSDSDWMDEACTDSDGDSDEDSSTQSRQKSEAGTTWDMMLDHHNVI